MMRKAPWPWPAPVASHSFGSKSWSVPSVDPEGVIQGAAETAIRIQAELPAPFEVGADLDELTRRPLTATPPNWSTWPGRALSDGDGVIVGTTLRREVSYDRAAGPSCRGRIHDGRANRLSGAAECPRTQQRFDSREAHLMSNGITFYVMVRVVPAF